jgi:hypothetical protein
MAKPNFRKTTDGDCTVEISASLKLRKNSKALQTSFARLFLACGSLCAVSADIS